MKKTHKFLALVLALLMIGSVMVGCGKTEQPADQTEDQQQQKDNAAKKEDAPKEEIVLKYAIQADAADGEEQKKLLELASADGVKAEFLVVPRSKDGEADKMLISLMGGDPIDIMYQAYPNMKRYYNANVIEPLEEHAKANNYDMEKVFGKYLPKFEDEVYGLPAFVDIWLTLYNKKVFDDAGVPYPSPEGWTWEKYIETAKKLTDAEKGIYGSYMLDYNNYNYMVAQQKGIPHYKADGTSNYDDPAFAEAMKFYYDLGNVHKIQPDILTFKSKKLPWDGFTGGKYGMFVCGGWTTYLMKNTEKYPRDWQFGILPMPYPEDGEKTTLTVTGCYFVPTTSKHKKEAFAAISRIAEKQYTLGYGRVPARVDLSEEEINRYITEELAKPFESDGVKAEAFKAAWFDPNMKVVPEKVIGPGDVMINQAFVEDGQLYGMGQQSLEDAMKSIKEKADKAIQEDKQ